MMHISTSADLAMLRKSQNLDAITLFVDQIKHTGALRVILRRALFALRFGGQLTVLGKPDKRQGIEPHRFGWPSVRALTLSSIGADCQIVDQSNTGQLVLTRATPLLSPGWSAGVIFSGYDEELPQLYACLDGLLRQPELSDLTGEVLVCGPKRDMSFLSAYPKVQYVPYEVTDEGPFPISDKKNYLMENMQGSRNLVLHTRIILDPGVLNRFPYEFDIMALDIQAERKGKREPDLGLIALDPAWPDIVPFRFERTTRHTANYLDLYNHHRVYVDGGAFAVTKPVLKKCQLNPLLRWGDCEDVEWAFRAQALGFSVDMVPGATAVSKVSKTKATEQIPSSLARGLRSGLRAWRWISNRYF